MTVGTAPLLLAEAMTRPAAQQPEWPEPARARAARELLRRAPPLVVGAEADRLTARLAGVARGEAFVLQGGDCAETFAANTEAHLRGNLEVLTDTATALARASGRQVVRIARMAGQYAKPRSAPTDGHGLPVYRGDMVNGFAATPADRAHDPARMLGVYAASAVAMNVVRVRRLDPDGVPGRLTLVSRMGHRLVREVLPPIVEKVTASGHEVVWQCDPMHGNTFVAPNGHKTRLVGDVVAELTGYFEVHRALGTHPGGVHLEFTGDDVTECVGAGVSVAELGERYTTACDPRLNPVQTAVVTAVLADLVRDR